MARNPDPGRVFEFEDERHVLGHLRPPHDTSEGKHPAGQPFTPEEFVVRVLTGTSFLNQYTPEQIHEVLMNLQSAGDAALTGDGWSMTEQGFAKLTGPNGYDPGPIPEAQADAMLASGEIDQEGYDAWREAFDEYHAA